MAYPGTCLLEATTLSEGRGTPAPFLLLGGPSLDGVALSGRVRSPGFALEPRRFTPRAAAAAPFPKHRDRELSGVRVRVTDVPAYDRFYKRLTEKVHLSDVSASFVMEELKETTALPIGGR